MTDTRTTVHAFFDRYAAALLARDEKAIAGMYAVPSLILFPGHSIPVSDAAQTEAFFAASWAQYEGVQEAAADVVVMATAPGSVWADVTWTYGGVARERFCYQLVSDDDNDNGNGDGDGDGDGDGGYRIAVLTPMELTPR